MNILSKLLEVLLQVVVFSLIPFIWWFVTARRKEPFLSWIGLKAVRGSWLAISGCILFFFLLSSLCDIPAVVDPFPAAG